MSKIICYFDKCARVFTNLNKLDDHLVVDHSEKLEEEKFVFHSESEFETWIGRLKDTDSVSYAFRSSSKYRKVLLCNRSSLRSRPPQGENKRNRKKGGPIASDKICRSRIIIDYDKKDENLRKVSYLKTHTGHVIEPGKVGLSLAFKMKVAHDIESGLSKQRVLENVRKNGITSETVSRIDLLNRQDIDNICRKYKLFSNVQFDPNDATSVDITVNKLKQENDNGVFMYKKWGVVDKDYPEFEEDDFCLGYMTTHQQNMLQLYGTNILCVDGTHGTNNYKFEMTTVLVINENSESFPVMFVFHKSKSESTYTRIFKEVKDKVGVIKPKVFMSDDEPAFYKGWANNMGHVENKLLCAWHVLKNWNKRLGANKFREHVWPRLYDLLYETDRPTFDGLLNEMMSLLSSEEELKDFHDYFNTTYNKRVSQWAGCYRLHLGINTNMSLENLHRELKHTYLEGKKCRRLDKSFAAVRAFLQNCHYKRMISFHRLTVTSKDKALRKAHKESMLLSNTNVMVFNDYYLVASSQNVFSFYKVTKVKDACGCNIKCFDCDTCIHSYWCSCPENSIRFNMCKHIHLLIRYVKDNGESESNNADKIVEHDDDEDQLFIATDNEKEVAYEENKIHRGALGGREQNFPCKRKRKTDLNEFRSFLNELETASEEEKIIALEAMDALKEKLKYHRNGQPKNFEPACSSKKLRAEHQVRYPNPDKTRKNKIPVEVFQFQRKQAEDSMLKNSIRPGISDGVDDDDFK